MWTHAAPLALLLLVVPSVRAQVPLITQPLDSGTLVRAHLSNGSVVRGRLLAPLVPPAASLRLCLYPGRLCAGPLDDRTRTLPVSDVRFLEVADGTRARTGALVGAVVGVLMGEAVHGLAEGMCESAGCIPPRWRADLVGALGGALWGALLGAGFDAWRPVQ